MNIICGPTSSGKTSLAIEICKEINAEIISADSRQVFKEMDIGTGKLPITDTPIEIKKGDSVWNVDGINIWGYDLVFPDEYFSAHDFAVFALDKVREIRSRKKVPILVGGTGLYIDVVTGRKRLDAPKPDFKIREGLNTTPTKNLLDKLKRLNPEVIKSIDQNNRHRIIRAIEIELLKEKKREPLDLLDEKHTFIGLTSARGRLYHRVDRWAKKMWDRGVVEETRNLMKKYPESEKLRGLVYKSVAAYLLNYTSEQDARERIRFDLHAYIRRQLTWFKANKDIKWVDIGDENKFDKVLNLIDRTI